MLRLEHHWYRITPLHLILFPISLVFRVLVALRREMYRNGILASHQLLLPVIVVGNISVGGTGKTPLTLALAQQLIERGSALKRHQRCKQFVRVCGASTTPRRWRTSTPPSPHGPNSIRPGMPPLPRTPPLT